MDRTVNEVHVHGYIDVVERIVEGNRKDQNQGRQERSELCKIYKTINLTKVVHFLQKTILIAIEGGCCGQKRLYRNKRIVKPIYGLKKNYMKSVLWT